MLSKLNVKNFTNFEEMEIAFSPRINVIIGTNGTGKTHLLKAIFGACLTASEIHSKSPDSAHLDTTLRKFLRTFSTESDKVGSLSTYKAKSSSQLQIKTGDDSTIELKFSRKDTIPKISYSGKIAAPIFIPTKEVFSLLRCLGWPQHDRATIDMIFDDTYIKLAEILAKPCHDERNSDLLEDPRLSTMVRRLTSLLAGRYQLKKGLELAFQMGTYQEESEVEDQEENHIEDYEGCDDELQEEKQRQAETEAAYKDLTKTKFVKSQTAQLSTDLTAEGHKKVGTLVRLLCNGSINPGRAGALLWDEPEANLNPKIMRELVQALLELSRNGQQIIIATHDYVLLKWLDLLMDKKGKEDHVRFHVLQKETDGKIRLHSTDEYGQLIDTGISKTFEELYEAEIDRSLQGLQL